MCKSKLYLFHAFLVLNQFGFLARAQSRQHSICIFLDGSLECGEFLSTILQQRKSTKLNENQEKLEKIEARLNDIQMEKENTEKTSIAMLATLEELIPQDLKDRLAKIENRQRVLQKSLEAQHKTIQNYMQIQQISIQKMINVQLETIKKLKFQDNEQRLSKIEATQMNNQFQLKNIWRTLSKLGQRQRFQAIALKFYYIEDNVTQNWTTAAQTCRQMGGHLASIQNSNEFLAIKVKIKPNNVYWLDINDHDTKGDFMSMYSGESVTFLRWLPGEPQYDDETQRYVNLFNGGMRVENASNKRNFICQYNEKD